jgi:hypothetical protein
VEIAFCRLEFSKSKPAYFRKFGYAWILPPYVFLRHWYEKTSNQPDTGE